MKLLNIFCEMSSETIITLFINSCCVEELINSELQVTEYSHALVKRILYAGSYLTVLFSGILTLYFLSFLRYNFSSSL